ncbi:hypothetical protein FEM48_Zijuj12G0074000 [Ziziphus jujuba var. spinosa]|uniref:Uncharacterized protein n=1 Tax=Ziziphus jujuba var. spinosa TaxID=714518 RepID=A0A978UBY8_ZIZJJ|nr:hypothetical protein FEM48_Zijuj12G0074000 [Ziziphus jujuba var. spinosa]
MGVGFMAVFAVSGSVVLLAHQVHKRLFSNFMKNIEFELNGPFYSHAHNKLASVVTEKNLGKKMVRFADDVVEPSSNNKEYRKRHCSAKQVSTMENNDIVQNQADHHHHHHHEGYKLEDTMPPNRVALYRGILQYKTLKGAQLYV